MAISKNNRHLYVVNTDTYTVEIDLKTQKITRDFGKVIQQFQDTHVGKLMTVTPNHKFLFMGVTKGTLAQIDLSTGKTVKIFLLQKESIGGIP